MAQGIEIMLVGMATVFAFLSLLVGLLHVSAALFAGSADPVAVAPAPAARQVSGAEEEEIAVVLAVAEAWRRRSDGEETR